jgi:hypothetical protein
VRKSKSIFSIKNYQTKILLQADITRLFPNKAFAAERKKPRPLKSGVIFKNNHIKGE